jgi:hypothetical protein
VVRVTSLLFFALLVVLEAFGKVLVDGEIDGFVVGLGVFVEQLGPLCWRLFGRRSGLVLHLARHVGEDVVIDEKQDGAAADGDMELFDRVYKDF